MNYISELEQHLAKGCYKFEFLPVKSLVGQRLIKFDTKVNNE